MQQDYLNSAISQFKYYKSLGDKTFVQLTDEQCFQSTDEEANSIAVIVNHLHGNMLSRWTNFLTEDGEKTWRNRDAEFESSIKTKAEMLEKWEKGWDCLFAALGSIDDSNFDTIIYIRNMGHTVVEAINRQMMHYAYHVGQIVFIGRMLKKEDWQSLSISKGASTAYNVEKFSKERRKEHFTKEFLEDE